MCSFSKQEVTKAIRKFRDYADDVQNSIYTTFDDNFGLFLHHCENDPVMKIIVYSLKNNPNISLSTWLNVNVGRGGSFIGSGSYSLPKDEDDRLSIVYQLFLAFSIKKVSFSGFCIEIFGKSNLDDMVDVFNEQLFDRFVRDVSYKLDDLQDRIESEEDVHVNDLIIFNIDKQISISKIQGSMIAVNGSSITNSTITTESDLARELVKLVKEVFDEHLINKETYDSFKEIVEARNFTNEDTAVNAIKSALQKKPAFMEKLKGLLIGASTSLSGTAIFEILKLLI